METWFIEGYDKYDIYNYCCMHNVNKEECIKQAKEKFDIVEIVKVYNYR